MANVYEIVTNQIIAQLERGVVPWRKPWRTEMPCNLVSGKPYRGINVFLLGMQARPSKYWLTFKQANQLGGHVRAGEKATVVTFWNVGEERLNAKTGKLSKPFLLRYYNVFNATQIDGLESLKLGNGAQPVPNIEACERIVPACRIRLNARYPTRPGIGQHRTLLECLPSLFSIPPKSFTRLCSTN